MHVNKISHIVYRVSEGIIHFCFILCLCVVIRDADRLLVTLRLRQTGVYALDCTLIL